MILKSKIKDPITLIFFAIIVLSAAGMFRSFMLRQKNTAGPDSNIKGAAVTHDVQHDSLLQKQPLSEKNDPMLSQPQEPVDEQRYEQFRKRLREQYIAVIDHPGMQLQCIQSLIRWLKKHYPETWEMLVPEYLTRLFPEHADDLVSRFHQMERFSAWLNDTEDVLINMPLADRKGLIQDKRIEIFGEDAQIIWEKIVQKEAVDELLTHLKEVDVSLKDKIDNYSRELDTIFKTDSSDYKKRHLNTLMNKFLSINSVQKALEQMTSSDRTAYLNELRKTLGMNDETLNRWKSLDRKRDLQWKNGRQYMEERQKLEATLSGRSLTDALRHLRNTRFGEQARQIETEETSGFFRFQRQRFYGKN